MSQLVGVGLVSMTVSLGLTADEITGSVRKCLRVPFGSKWPVVVAQGLATD